MLDAPLREGSTDSIDNWALGGSFLLASLWPLATLT